MLGLPGEFLGSWLWLGCRSDPAANHEADNFKVLLWDHWVSNIQRFQASHCFIVYQALEAYYA